MLGDESIGDVALAEADIPSVLTPSLSAVAEFSWSVATTAEFAWSEGVGAFSWE